MKTHRIWCIQSNERVNLFSFFFMSLPQETEAIYRKLCNKTSSYDVSMKHFLSQYLGMTINVALIWILFFSLGIPTVVKYGYPFEMNRKTWVCHHLLITVLSQQHRLQMVPFHRECTDPVSFLTVCFS